MFNVLNTNFALAFYVVFVTNINYTKYGREETEPYMNFKLSDLYLLNKYNV